MILSQEQPESSLKNKDLWRRIGIKSQALSGFLGTLHTGTTKGMSIHVPLPGDHDYSADPPRRPRPRDDFDASQEADDRDSPSTRRVVQKLVRTAGIIWFAFGCLSILNAVLNLATTASQADANFAGVGCGVLSSIAYRWVGMQSLEGTATDTVGYGIGSLVIGLLFCPNRCRGPDRWPGAVHHARASLFSDPAAPWGAVAVGY